MVSHEFETEKPRPKIGSESKTQHTAIEIMKFEECGECNLKFHRIGTLSGGKRVKHHKRIKKKYKVDILAIDQERVKVIVSLLKMNLLDENENTKDTIN